MSSQQEPMLPDTAWQFWRVDNDDEKFAWEWEILIEAYPLRHWLNLTDQEKRNIRAYNSSTYPIKEYPIEMLSEGQLRREENTLSATSHRRHVIDIQWSAGAPRIIKALTDWVKTHDNRNIPVDPAHLPKNKLGGRPTPCKSRLACLAIFRLRKHYAPEDVEAKMKLFVKWINIDSNSIDMLSVPRQHRAIAIIRTELNRVRKLAPPNLPSLQLSYSGV